MGPPQAVNVAFEEGAVIMGENKVKKMIPKDMPEGLTMEILMANLGEDANGATQNAVKLFAGKGCTWTKCMKPMVGGESCQKEHFGYCTKGKIQITVMKNGKDRSEGVTEYTIGPDQVYWMGPGHDMEILEDVEGYEFNQVTAGNILNAAGAGPEELICQPVVTHNTGLGGEKCLFPQVGIRKAGDDKMEPIGEDEDNWVVKMSKVDMSKENAADEAGKAKNAKMALCICCKQGVTWSSCMKPIAKTESCQSAHFGVLLAGKMKVFMHPNDAEKKYEREISAGECFFCPADHDMEVLADMKMLEFNCATAATANNTEKK